MRFRPAKKPQGPHSRHGLWPRLRRRWLALAAALTTSLASGPAGPPPAAPAASTPAPPATTQPLALPDPVITRMPVTRCIAASELAGSPLYPQLSPVFNALAAQPVSGTPVITRVITADQGIQTCVSRDLPRGTMLAAYESATKRLIVGLRNVSPAIVAHEAFHAYQHLNGGFTGVGSNRLLTAGDRATGLLLIEASAAAYAMVAMKEASLDDPAAAAHMRRYDYGMRGHFNETFDTHYAAHAGQPEDARRRLALQAAGQAMVAALMNGDAAEWKNLYHDDAAHYLSQPSHTGPRTAEYGATRDALYARIGQVAPGLQLIPPAFFGPAANEAIAASQRATGLRVPAQAGKDAPPPVPRRPAA